MLNDKEIKEAITGEVIHPRDTHNSYPFDCIASKEFFPNRPDVEIDDYGFVVVKHDVAVFGEIPNDLEYENSFYRNRLFDYSEALNICEGQVEDLLKDDPFMPEGFGFNLDIKPESISDTPVRVYSKGEFVLYRDYPVDGNNWVLGMKDENGKLTNLKLDIPNHRFAFHVFYSLGVINK